jgi:hypothetical protein
MRRRIFGCAFLMAILSLVPPRAAQDIDAIITSENRKAASIATRSMIPQSAQLFSDSLRKTTPEKGLELTRFPSTLSPICIPRHDL